MRQIRVTFFFLAVALTLGGCGVFGGSDGTDLSAVAPDITPQPTVNSVQAVPATTPQGSTTDAPAAADDSADDGATAALPTAVTLPTAAPTPEPTVDRSQPTTYIVQSGDVLGLIAERFDADIAELRRVNDLDGNLIRVGQELTIPAADGSTTTDSDSSDSDTTESADSGDAAPAPTSAPAAAVSCNSTASGHCVQPGESLLGIALKYDITVEALRNANPGISGDLIKSGEVLNLPGGSSSSDDPAAAPTAVTAAAPAGTAVPAATVGPINDADCKARNPEFPYFHAADGLCYANPIGGPTPVPTVPGSQATGDGTDITCPAGRFLWQDGLCYPIPGVTVTPEPTATGGPVTGRQQEDYGRPPCREGYVVLVSTNQCWPEATNTSPATVTAVATATTSTGSTTTSTGSGTGNEVSCVGPRFAADDAGRCFLLQPGVDENCTVSAGRAFCP